MEGNKKLPKGWIIKKIGDVVFYQKGKLPKSFSKEPKEGFLSYIDIKAFEDASVRRYAKNDNVVLTSEADVLIVWDGSRFGFSGMGVSGVLGSTLARLYSEIIDVKYLYYFLQSKYRFINSRPRGTGTPHVDPEVFWNLDFSIAPLNEQKRIVDKIETLFSDLDKGEALLKQVQQQLRVYRQSVLKAAVTGELTREWREQNEHRLESGEALLQRIFELRRKNWKGRGKYQEPTIIDTSALPKIPDTWVWVSIESLACDEKNAIKAGPFGSALKKEFYVGSGYKIYGQEQVISGDSQYGDYYINEEKYELLKSCAVKPFDVLISLVGTIGKVMVLPEKIEPGIINPRLIKISFDLSIYDPKFFKMYFESAFLKSMYHLDAHGATMDILNLSIIKNLPFVLCSSIEQKEIISKVDDIFSQIDALEKWCATELARSEMLRQSILKAAFSGDLVPQDPRDEPASELLARIQAERASAARDGNAPKTTGRRGRKATT